MAFNMPVNHYRFVEHWDIPDATPDEVYAVLSDARLLPRWWVGVYLTAEALGDGDDPRVGDRARVTARGFLPYKLNFVLEATALAPGRLVETRAVGDFVGVWRGALSPTAAGTRVDIDWTVTVEKPLVRFLSPLLKPIFVRNHNWTTLRGEAGLRAYLAEQRAAKDVMLRSGSAPDDNAPTTPGSAHAGHQALANPTSQHLLT
jgi:hypothetical protein